MIFTPGKNNHHKRKSQQQKKKPNPKIPTKQNKSKQNKTKQNKGKIDAFFKNGYLFSCSKIVTFLVTFPSIVLPLTVFRHFFF